MNLRWAWDPQTRDLFRWVDPDAWDASVHDPVQLLGLVSPERLAALMADDGFMRYLTDARDELDRYLDSPRWFQSRAGGETSPLDQVAYFSPEFGIAEALPQYSGGLGVLAGDHLKAASDLGVPLSGIGLFYRHGYFRQALNSDGWQQEAYPNLDPYAMAISECEDIRVHVELGETPIVARVWRADVGRVPLYLLDTDIDENADEMRSITDRLYGGDIEHRLRQEILLGIGGVRALEALGIDTQVFHTNEGHAGFLGLERIRRLIVSDGLDLPEAVEAVRAGNVFTTHTPVPAGIDRFPRELMARYFSGWTDACGIGLDDLMALGHRPADPPDDALQHGGHGAPPGRTLQRGVQAARSGEPRDVRRSLAGRAGRRDPDHLGHQRRARGHLDVVRDGRPVQPPRPPRLARSRRRTVGAHRGGQRRRAVAGTGAGTRANGRVRAHAPQGGGGQARQLELGHGPLRPRTGPARAHDRVRPPLRDLQARRRCC